MNANMCMFINIYWAIEEIGMKLICSGECRAYRESAELLHSGQRGQLVGGDVQLLRHPGVEDEMAHRDVEGKTQQRG